MRRGSAATVRGVGVINKLSGARWQATTSPHQLTSARGLDVTELCTILSDVTRRSGSLNLELRPLRRKNISTTGET